jgi:hypothetical protein
MWKVFFVPESMKFWPAFCWGFFICLFCFYLFGFLSVLQPAFKKRKKSILLPSASQEKGHRLNTNP